ncbi:hypothetical protein BKA62DRAFT_690734 [Auriculariales sp. MPI-PUGE-AT-0066]|nr:hypothetical protein BKA62DRAFT_690734 [Auriculariales sp. MPI-PUGE-AT-0066]
MASNGNIPPNGNPWHGWGDMNGHFWWKGRGHGWGFGFPHAEAAQAAASAAGAASGAVHPSHHAFHHYQYNMRRGGGRSRLVWFLVGAGTVYWATHHNRNCDERKELKTLRARFRAESSDRAEDNTPTNTRSWQWEWPPKNDPNWTFPSRPQFKQETAEATLQALEAAQKAINAKIDAFRAAMLKANAEAAVEQAARGASPPSQQPAPQPVKRWF